MGKIVALLDLLRKGNAVADPALWKDRSALTLALTGLILALTKAAKGFGYDLGIDDASAATMAAGVAVFVGLFANYATSDKVGILPAKPDVPAPSVQPEPAPDVPAAPDMRG